MSTSRLSQARKAVRPALKGRLMLSGPPGAGKTRTALIGATELAEGGPILVVDTERESALTYADDFDFVHLPWRPPYAPDELASVLREACGQYAVIVVDSFTHFWRGEGGVLDVAGGKFTGWKEARPLHESLLRSILECDAHMILGVRSKVDYVQEIENGRHVVRKLGMADQQDDNLAFEMNVGIELSMDHVASISKSRTTALPVGRDYTADRHVEMFRAYRAWLKGGEPPITAEMVEHIRRRMDALEPKEYRNRCKAHFEASFGRPAHVRESMLDAVNAAIKGYEDGSGDGTGSSPDDDPDGAPFEPSAPEPTPEPAVEVPAGAAPAPPAAEGTERPPVPSATIDAREAQQLHRDLGRGADKKHGYGIGDKADHEALIYCCTSGRTVHAAEITPRELYFVYQRAQEIKDGRLTLDRVRQLADEHRAQTARGDAAVADFLARIAS